MWKSFYVNNILVLFQLLIPISYNFIMVQYFLLEFKKNFQEWLLD